MSNLSQLREQWINWQKKKEPPRKIPAVPLQHGWLLEELIGLDDLIWGRWHYWALTIRKGDLLDTPIPKINFSPNPLVRQHLENCLDCIPNHGKGQWQGWSSTEYVDYFLDWLLFGLGHKGQPDPPHEPLGCQGASDRLLKTFDLSGLMLFPQDYFGDILADLRWGKVNQFYPTHLNICLFKADILAGETDRRRELAADPCCGTGRMMIVLSNHVLVICGMDISNTCVRATLVNSALFAPWIFRPIPFLDRPRTSEQLAKSLFEAGHSDPAIATYLDLTEHDPENQWRFEPIIIGRKKGKSNNVIGDQGCLF